MTDHAWSGDRRQPLAPVLLRRFVVDPPAMLWPPRKAAGGARCGLLPLHGCPRPTAAHLAQRIAAIRGVSLADLRSPSRQRAVAWPRQELMWALRCTAGWSLPRIGRYLGGRDHTTVLHGIRAHAKRMAEGA